MKPSVPTRQVLGKPAAGAGLEDEEDNAPMCLLSPKSAIFRCRPLSRRTTSTFAGFKSRWATPAE